MTFELTPEQEAARVRARLFAQERLSASATAIDEHGVIAGDLLRDLTSTVAAAEADPTAMVVTVEELAAVSASAAAAGAMASGASASPNLCRGRLWCRACRARGRAVGPA
jgi:hypothetical protein